MEDIKVSIRSHCEKSAGMLSETSSWTRDLSNMTRITQELISQYLLKEMVCGSLVKGYQLNPKVTNFLNNIT